VCKIFNKGKIFTKFKLVPSFKIKLCTLSFWIQTLKQSCRAWKVLQLSFWTLFLLSSSLKVITGLQTGPWNFKKIAFWSSHPQPSFFFFLWLIFSAPLFLLCRRRNFPEFKPAVSSPLPSHPHAPPLALPAALARLRGPFPALPRAHAGCLSAARTACSRAAVVPRPCALPYLLLPISSCPKPSWS
jgi:hypothetical protein